MGAIEPLMLLNIRIKNKEHTINSSIGPRAKQCMDRLLTQPLTGKWSIKLNIYLLYWHLQQNQCFNIEKNPIPTQHT